MKVFILTILVIVPFTASSQQQAGNQGDTTRIFLSEVTVTANRSEQLLREVPGKIRIIHKSEIEFQNPQTAADLLSISNDVYIQKSQLGGGSPMIRGFATNRVLLVIDGVRMNNAIFRAGNVQNVISLDANAIQNAEVLFGPGSVLYGSDAIGGVMNFTTLAPRFSTDNKTVFNSNAMLRYSSANNEQTAHADFNIGLANWSFLTSITHSKYDDLTMGSDGPAEYTRPEYAARINNKDTVIQNSNPNVQLFSGYDQWNAMQKIAFRSGKNFKATYAFHFSQTSNYPRYDRLILKDAGGNLTSSEWYYGPQKWQMHSLALALQQTSGLFDELSIGVAYQFFQEGRHNRNFGSSQKNNRTEQVHAFSLNLDFHKRLREKVTLNYGGELISNNTYSNALRVNVSNGTTTPLSTRYPNDSDWRSFAAYAGLQLKPADKVIVSLSARYSHIYSHAKFDTTFFDFPFTESTNNNSAFNGSAGLVYNPTDHSKLYVNLTTGFRAPNIDDIGKVFDSTPGTVVVPNPQLKSEYAYNAEVGFASSISNRLDLDAAVYGTVISNAIVRGPFLFNGEDSIDYDGTLSKVYALQNISEVRVAGVQVGLRYRATEKFSLKSYLSYQKGKEKDPETNRDNPPTHVAPLFGSTHLIFDQGALKLDLYSNYNGQISYDDLALTERADQHLYAKDANGNPYSPSWATLNLKSSIKLSKVLKLDIGIENILDKRYRPYSSGIAAPGRNFIVALHARL